MTFPSSDATHQQSRPSLAQLEMHDAFHARHIAPDANDQQQMLSTLGFNHISELMNAVIPAAIRRKEPLPLPVALNEHEALNQLKQLANQNQVLRSLIGQGYYGTDTPAVILRNVLENPAWYTAYTPYQPEISQGRLEAMLNFQQMVMDLSGMDMANASMLDEGTAAAEAMALAQRLSQSQSKTFLLRTMFCRKQLKYSARVPSRWQSNYILPLRNRQRILLVLVRYSNTPAQMAVC